MNKWVVKWIVVSAVWGIFSGAFLSLLFKNCEETAPKSATPHALDDCVDVCNTNHFKAPMVLETGEKFSPVAYSGSCVLFCRRGIWGSR